jgi:hypothetical protein
MTQTIPLMVLDEHPDWLQPLYEEFDRQGIPFQKSNISSGSYDPAEYHVLPFYFNRLSPSASKRGHQAAFNYTLDYVQYLEFQGARVVNGWRTVLLETSKAYQLALLASLKLPHPKSIVLNHLEHLEKMSDALRFPIVTKPNCGGSGLGVQKFESQQELSRAVKEGTVKLPPEKVLIAQEFIQPQGGRIVRVETVNGRVIYAMSVFTEGTFNLCPANGCDLTRTQVSSSAPLGYCAATSAPTVRFELYPDLPSEIVKAVEQVVRVAGLECGGIEYVVDQAGQWYIYDINALSILRASFKEEYGIDGWKMLAEYCVGEFKHTLEQRGLR